MPCPQSKTVTYSSEYGEAPSALQVIKGYALKEADLPELEADGKTFGGWFIGENEVEAGFIVNEDVTLTAAWS